MRPFKKFFRLRRLICRVAEAEKWGFSEKMHFCNKKVTFLFGRL